MLKVSEIKKIFDNFEVEGFRIYKDSCRLTFEMPCSKLITVDKKYWDSEDFRNIIPVYYPLFLQRVIEGINKEYYTEGSRIKPIGIREMPKGITVFHAVLGWEQDFDYEYEYNVIEAKEEAIKYILNQL